MHNITQKLLGAWQLRSCVFTDSTGQLHYPLGHNPSGLLIYLPNGTMSAQLMGSGRSRFSTEDWASAPLEEIKDAFVSYQAYYGQYEIHIEENMLIHHVECALFPNWHLDHSQQKRYFKLDGNFLTLSTMPLLMSGNEKVFSLVWEKAI